MTPCLVEEVEKKTLSRILDAHASDIREAHLIDLDLKLKVLEVRPELQKLPAYGPEVTGRTFSDNPNAHSILRDSY